MSNSKTRDMVLCAIFSAIIIVMTVVPFTGYISYGVVIEFTTLHIPVIIGAVALGWKYGAILGGVWGLTCMMRAFTNVLWLPFANPLISLVPRIIVGLVAGGVFALARKKGLHGIPSAILAAVLATLTNTVLVISALYAFSDIMGSAFEFYNVFKSVWMSVSATNGIIEIALAVALTPALFTAIRRQDRKLRDSN